jgi:hypothetical protein
LGDSNTTIIKIAALNSALKVYMGILSPTTGCGGVQVHCYPQGDGACHDDDEL